MHIQSLQQRHSQLRYLQGYISSLASRTGHHSHNHPSLSVVSVAGTASSYGFGPLESSDSGPSQSLVSALAESCYACGGVVDIVCENRVLGAA